MTEPRCVLFHDNFQNFKSYNIPKAQLVIADIPYRVGLLRQSPGLVCGRR